MSRRFDIERALGRSGLPAPSRAIARVLCECIDKHTGTIQPHHSPSLKTLAARTGYDKSTVARHLAHLAETGWITRHPPSLPAALAQQATTTYDIHIPVHRAVAQCDTASRGPRHAPVAHGDTGCRSGRPNQGGDRDRSAAAPTSSSADDDALRELVKSELRELTGRVVGDRQAAEAVRLVLDGRRVRDRARYLLTALRADPNRFAPPAGNAPPFAELKAKGLV